MPQFSRRTVSCDTTYRQFALIAWLLVAAMLPAVAFADSAPMTDILIIGHPDLPVDTLPLSELKLIFKGEHALWSDTLPITFVLLRGGPAHTTFVKQYLRKTPQQYSRYWKKLIFSGRGFPPPTFNTPEKAVAYIKETPGAIGYVPVGTPVSGVKLISVRYD